MRYNGEIPFPQWQKSAREKLCSLVGIDRFSECPDDFTIEYSREENDFFETRFRFQSEEGYYVPCHLLVPKNSAPPFDVMLCLQGHGKGMHISLGRKHWEDEDISEALSGDRDLAVQAVSHGMAALVMEQRNFGECGGTPDGPDCYNSAMTALLCGRTTIGERVWDIMRLIDTALEHFPQLNKDSIYCTGNSGGGTATFYAACIDERIAGAVPSCSVCTYSDSIGAMRHCACNYIPDIANYFDMGDLGGLIAPRILVVAAGRQDGIFPIEGVKESYEIIQKLYTFAGASDSCALVIGEGGHRYYAEKTWKEFTKLKGLKNKNG